MVRDASSALAELATSSSKLAIRVSAAFTQSTIDGLSAAVRMRLNRDWIFAAFPGGRSESLSTHGLSGSVLESLMFEFLPFSRRSIIWDFASLSLFSRLIVASF